MIDPSGTAPHIAAGGASAPGPQHAEAAFADWPGDAPWQRLPDAARRSFRVAALLRAAVLSSAVFGLPLFVGIIDQEPGLSLPELGWTLLPIAAIFGFALWRASVAYRNVRWRLDEDGLRVRRGRIWRSEVLVPRARVQHLDIERGPIERRYGLATLIVHTAGTRMNALRQPGFDEDTAARLRDALVPKLREVDLPAAAPTESVVSAGAPGFAADAGTAAAARPAINAFSPPAGVRTEPADAQR